MRLFPWAKVRQPAKPAKAPKSTKAKATKSKAKKGILDILKKDEEPKASK